MIIPKGDRVLFLPDKVNKYSPGGIEIPEPIRDRQQADSVRGIVVAIGHTAWTDYKGENFAEIGDAVLIARHSGVAVYDYDDTLFFIRNDIDILAVLNPEKTPLPGEK